MIAQEAVVDEVWCPANIIEMKMPVTISASLPPTAMRTSRRVPSSRDLALRDPGGDDRLHLWRPAPRGPGRGCAKFSMSA